MKHDIYEEYNNWLNENQEFINALDEKAPFLAAEFELEFYILETLSELAKQNEKLDEDQDDVFYFGFDYLSYAYEVLQLFSEQLYDDLKEMDKHVDAILAYLYLDVLILNVEMELDAAQVEYNEVTTNLNTMLEEAEHYLVDKKDIPLELIEKFEAETTKILEEYETDIYLDDVLLLEYAEEHGLIELEEE